MPSCKAAPCLSIPQRCKIRWDAKAGLCAEGGSSDQGPRGRSPGPSMISLFFPRYWPKRDPLAQKPLHLTLGDLDARANLDWLPPLGPHADMQERFAVTLTDRTSSNQRRQTTFSPSMQPNDSTPPHPHTAQDRHSPAQQLPEVPRCVGDATSLLPLRRKCCGRIAQIRCRAQVPTVTPGRCSSRHSTHDTWYIPVHLAAPASHIIQAQPDTATGL